MRHVIKLFAKEMEAKMKQNDSKGDWAKESYAYLLSRLLEEIGELYSEFIRDDIDRDIDAIISEAADVANFAMMISDKARKKKEKNV